MRTGVGAASSCNMPQASRHSARSSFATRLHRRRGAARAGLPAAAAAPLYYYTDDCRLRLQQLLRCSSAGSSSSTAAMSDSMRIKGHRPSGIRPCQVENATTSEARRLVSPLLPSSTHVISSAHTSLPPPTPTTAQEATQGSRRRHARPLVRTHNLLTRTPAPPRLRASARMHACT